MASIDHDGHWFVANPSPRGSERGGLVVAGLCLGVAAVCAVLLGVIL